MKFSVSPIEGLESLHALQAFQKLLLGVKQLPEYSSEAYEDFFARVENMSEKEQEQVIRKAVLFIELLPDEQDQLVRWAKDSNGIKFSRANLKSMSPADIFEILVAVCLEFAKIKINFVTELEKKN